MLSEGHVPPADVNLYATMERRVRVGQTLDGEPSVLKNAPERTGVVGAPVIALTPQTARPVRPHEHRSAGDEDTTQLVQARVHL